MITFLGLCIVGLLFGLVGLRLIDTHEPATVGFLVHVLGYAFILEAFTFVWPMGAVSRIWDRVRRR